MEYVALYVGLDDRVNFQTNTERGFTEEKRCYNMANRDKTGNHGNPWCV